MFEKFIFELFARFEKNQAFLSLIISQIKNWAEGPPYFVRNLPESLISMMIHNLP